MPVASATAAGPERIPLESGTFSYPAGQVCDFAITVEETPNNEVIKFFPDGRTIISGQYKVTITNDENGEQMSLNASGPIFFGPEGDVKLPGPQLFTLFAGLDFMSGIYLGHGNFTVTRNELGGAASIDGPGRISDNLCSEIA